MGETFLLNSLPDSLKNVVFVDIQLPGPSKGVSNFRPPGLFLVFFWGAQISHPTGGFSICNLLKRNHIFANAHLI